jgi:hypothetical protein
LPAEALAWREMPVDAASLMMATSFLPAMKAWHSRTGWFGSWVCCYKTYGRIKLVLGWLRSLGCSCAIAPPVEAVLPAKAPRRPGAGRRPTQPAEIQVPRPQRAPLRESISLLSGLARSSYPARPPRSRTTRPLRPFGGREGGAFEARRGRCAREWRNVRRRARAQAPRAKAVWGPFHGPAQPVNPPVKPRTRHFRHQVGAPQLVDELVQEVGGKLQPRDLWEVDLACCNSRAEGWASGWRMCAVTTVGTASKPTMTSVHNHARKRLPSRKKKLPTCLVSSSLSASASLTGVASSPAAAPLPIEVWGLQGGARRVGAASVLLKTTFQFGLRDARRPCPEAPV